MYKNISFFKVWNQVSWRLMVEERIANIGKLRTLFLECFDVFLRKKKYGSLVFANQPTVHRGGVSRGRSVAVAVTISDCCHWWHMTGEW